MCYHREEAGCERVWEPGIAISIMCLVVCFLQLGPISLRFHCLLHATSERPNVVPEWGIFYSSQRMRDSFGFQSVSAGMLWQPKQLYPGGQTGENRLSWRVSFLPSYSALVPQPIESGPLPLSWSSLEMALTHPPRCVLCPLGISPSWLALGVHHQNRHLQES